MILNNEDRSIFFLGGLPRSGSTLMLSIFSQNPQFYCGPTSPLCLMSSSLNSLINGETIQKMLGSSDKKHITKEYMESLFKIYYSDVDKNKYILDKSRSWTNVENVKIIKKYIEKNPKVLILVRDTEEIVKSFLRMNKEKIVFDEELIFSENSDPLMSCMGDLIPALNSYSKDYLFLDYNFFLNNPELSMKKIYQFFDIDFFNHDFSNIPNSLENDVYYEVMGLHEVMPSLKKRKYEINISEQTKKNCKFLNSFIQEVLDKGIVQRK